jgi:hypothetical protein
MIELYVLYVAVFIIGGYFIHKFNDDDWGMD